MAEAGDNIIYRQDRQPRRRLLENILSLSLLQAVSYLLPLVAIPYLVRTLGIEKFGLVMFAQAVVQYFILLSDFGFNLSATREIAANRGDSAKLATIFSAVMINRLLLMVAGFVLLYALILAVPRFSKDSTLFLVSFGMVIGNVLFPSWLFQGLEKMKLVTILVVAARSIFVVLIFVVVRSPDDYLFVPLLNSIGWIISACAGLWLVVTRFHIRFTYPGRIVLWYHLRTSAQFFLSRASVWVYGSLNAIVLGFTAGDATVGYYVATEKIFIAMRNSFEPLVLSLYPFMTADKDMRTYKRLFVFAFGVALIGSALVFALSPEIVTMLFGNEFQTSARLLRIFCIAVPFAAASAMIGYPLLAALGYKRFANYSIVGGSILHLVLVAILIPILSAELLAGLIVLTEAVILAIRVYAVKRYRLWR